MDAEYLRVLLSHFPVIPLQPDGRTPYLKYSEATVDIDRVREWERRWGERMGLAILLVDHTMIDVDIEGAAFGIELPLTWRSNTSRGYHLLYRGVTKASTVGKIAKGIDTHSGARQIMPVYPTMHHAGLVRYEWDWDLMGGPIAELPAELAERIGAPNGEVAWEDCEPASADAIGRALIWIADQPGAIEGQEGSKLTFTIACTLRRKFGLNDDQCMTVLSMGYNDRCVPPWSESELRNKVKYSRRAIADYVPELESLGQRIEGVSWDDSVGVIAHARDVSLPPPPIDWICEPLGIAKRGAPTLVHGYSHSGKTMAAQSAILSLCTGRPIWGTHRVERPIRVVHIDYEQGEYLTWQRYYRLAVGMGIDLREIADSSFRMVTSPKIFIHEKYRDRLFKLLESVDLVVWDSLHVACQGIEENSADSRDYLDLLNQLCQLLPKGCQHWLLHHERKSGEDNDATQVLRGSSALADASDNIIRFNASKDRDGLHKVQHTKNKVNGKTLDDFYLRIRDTHPKLNEGGLFEPGSEGGVIVETASIEDIETGRRESEERREELAIVEACERLLEILVEYEATDSGYLGRDELRFKIGIRQPIVTAALLRLQEQGLITRERQGTRLTTYYPRGAKK